MTLIEAQVILRPPLKFGDAEQIKAHEFWVAVLDLHSHVEGCEECNFSKYRGLELSNCAPKYPDEVQSEVSHLFSTPKAATV
jgi:hypothetical protein